MAHYLITGHTGFKGAWLVFLLKAQGHDVSGLALDPLPGSIFDLTNLENDLVHDFRVDIRNRDETVEAIRHAEPDYVIHMAAQALVREGYRNPRYTYETNVSGTLNVLDAVDQTDSVRAQLIVTTDKVYLDQGLDRPYVETDPLGGKDPYSASKAMADILTQEYLSRDGAKPGAIARAGNVIGAGDVSDDRLIVDIVTSLLYAKPISIRNPTHVRPWQHVLDCLDGYLLLLEASFSLDRNSIWNIGPQDGSNLSVAGVLDYTERIVSRLDVRYEPSPNLPEEKQLNLDCSKIQEILGWQGRLNSETAIQWALAEILVPGVGMRELIKSQIDEWTNLAQFPESGKKSSV